MKKTVLIAGGSGVIGSSISNLLEKNGYIVKILTRQHIDDEKYVHWKPEDNHIEWDESKNIDLLINLCGSGIAEKRWTKKRKEILESSRIDTTSLLFDFVKSYEIELGAYIGASGITAFPFDTGKMYSEHDEISGGYLQEVVRKWEDAHFQFESITRTSVIRVSPVLAYKSGLVVKMRGVIQKGLGSYLGNGKQMSPWIHHEDLSRMFMHIDKNNLTGIFHGAVSNCSNKTLTDELAKALNKKIWLPKVPKFLLKIMFGEMSEIMLGSLKTTNQRIIESGFEFNWKELDKAVEDVVLW